MLSAACVGERDHARIVSARGFCCSSRETNYESVRIVYRMAGLWSVCRTITSLDKNSKNKAFRNNRGCEFICPSTVCTPTQKKRRHHFFQMVSSDFFWIHPDFGRYDTHSTHHDTQIRTIFLPAQIFHVR